MPENISDVSLKTVNGGKMLIIMINDSYEKMGSSFTHLIEWMDQKQLEPAGPFFAYFYDTVLDFKKDRIKYEVAVEIDKEVEGEDVIQYREDIDKEAVVATYTGPYEQISDAYEKILKWIDENGYKVNGPAREIYIVNRQQGKYVDPDDFKTEIQIPVMK